MESKWSEKECQNIGLGEDAAYFGRNAKQCGAARRKNSVIQELKKSICELDPFDQLMDYSII